MNKILTLDWEFKKTIHEKIDINELCNYIENNNFETYTMGISYYYQENSDGSIEFEEMPYHIQEQILNAVEKEMKKRHKTTLAQIAVKIDDLICYLQPQQFFPEVINKKCKILEMIERYKNGE